MNLFVISGIDRPDSLDLRLATREAHLAFLGAQTCVKIGGPYLDTTGRMVGSMMVIEAESLTAAEAFAACDPYAKAGLFEIATVRPWKQTVGSGAL